MKRVLALAAAAMSIACRDLGPEYNEVLQQRALWNQHAMHDYDFEYTISCYCSSIPTYRIQVRNGVAIAATKMQLDVFTLDSTTTSVTVEPSRTMDWVFSKALNAARTADEVSFAFDATYGYPTTMNIDDVREIADEEEYWTIKLLPLAK